MDREVFPDKVLLELCNELSPHISAVRFAIHHILDAYISPMLCSSILHIRESKDNLLLFCAELCFVPPDVEGTFMKKVGESFPISIERGRGLYIYQGPFCP